MTTVEQKRGDLLAPFAIAVVLFKVFVLLFTWFVIPLFPGLFSTDAYLGNFHFPGDTPPTRATPFATWDAQHYLYLATEGYGPGRPSIAFFPLFPWLIRALAVLPGIGPLTERAADRQRLVARRRPAAPAASSIAATRERASTPSSCCSRSPARSSSTSPTPRASSSSSRWRRWSPSRENDGSWRRPLRSRSR